MTSRYDTGHLTEDQFEPSSRGRVLKNLQGIRNKTMVALEAAKLAVAIEPGTEKADKDQWIGSIELPFLYKSMPGPTGLLTKY